MPRADYLRKLRAKWHLGDGSLVDGFLTVLNSSARLEPKMEIDVMKNAVFDPVRFESHARVRAEALRCAEALVAAGKQRMRPTEGPLVSTAALRELLKDDLLEGESRAKRCGAAHAWRGNV